MMDDKAILTLFSPTISRECTPDGLKRLTKLADKRREDPDISEEPVLPHSYFLSHVQCQLGSQSLALAIFCEPVRQNFAIDLFSC